MNDENSKKYMLSNYDCLYPDVADTEGHRVILKVDSGPD